MVILACYLLWMLALFSALRLGTLFAGLAVFLATWQEK